MLASCAVRGPATVSAFDVGGKPVLEVQKLYLQALGGEAAVDRITTRKTKAARHHGPKRTYYWQKPDKVLLLEGKEKIGYEGGSGWMLSSKKHVTKLPKGLHLPLEADANPLRFAHLDKVYSELQPARPELLDGRKTDVLTAPNDLGATRLYFDAESHLLIRIVEKGEVSAYYEHVTEFSDFQKVDGVQLPFRIVHRSTEPSAKAEDLRVSEVEQNIPLRPDLFAKPSSGALVLGGKR